MSAVFYTHENLIILYIPVCIYTYTTIQVGGIRGICRSGTFFASNTIIFRNDRHIIVYIELYYILRLIDRVEIFHYEILFVLGLLCNIGI